MQAAHQTHARAKGIATIIIAIAYREINLFIGENTMTIQEYAQQETRQKRQAERFRELATGEQLSSDLIEAVAAVIESEGLEGLGEVLAAL